MDITNPNVVRTKNKPEGKFQITHYTNYLDESGRPFAVDPNNHLEDTIAGELPEDWHPDFWDWEPLGDLRGTWVKKEEAVRQVTWNEAKQQRANSLQGYITIKVNGRDVQFSTDPETANTLHRKLKIAELEPKYTAPWITPDNVVIYLTKEDLQSVVIAIEHSIDDLYIWSHEARAYIFGSEGN